jgi:hypothetical protein
LSANEQLESLLRRGIQAARTGDRATARTLLEAVIARDESHELAWIWLASTVTTVRERRICLEKVLQLNPQNARAREALNALVGVGGDSSPLDSAMLEQSASQRLSGASGDNASGLLANPLVRLGIVLGGVVGLFLISIVFFRTPTPPPLPTSRPLPTATPFLSPTPVLSPTFAGVLVTRDPATQILPPTFTPTPTERPSATPTPTQTPFPLGEFVLFYTGRNAEQTQPGLYRVLGDGSDERGLVENATDVTFDLSGQKIAFVREHVYPADETTAESRVNEIFTAPANNPNNATKITAIRTHSAHSPTFSPDGRLIVFVSDFDGDEDLWLIDTETGITTQLTDNEWQDRDPDWSPDGTTVLFASDQASPGYMEIYAMNMLDPTGTYPATRLTDDNGSSYAPRWSPDGTRIVYINAEAVRGSVFLMNADGTRRTRLTRATDADDQRPDWTPDSQWIAFLSNRDGDVYQVYLVDLRGREVLRVTQDERDITAMHFQPDIRFRLN